MASLRTITVSLGSVLVLALPTAYADLASGTYNYAFDDEICLWDISGTYSEDVGPVQVNYTVNMDGAGKLLGQGNFTYEGETGDYLNGDMLVTGSIKGAAGVSRVMLMTKLIGDGYISGVYVTFSAQMKENLEVNRVSNEMIGSASGKMTVAVPEFGQKQSAPIPLSENRVSLPADADGNWNLSLNVATNGMKYTGTATVQLTNGRSVGLSVTGSYSVKTDLSKVALKGVPPGPPMKLNLVVSFEQIGMAIQSLKGKAFGQSLIRQ